MAQGNGAGNQEADPPESAQPVKGMTGYGCFFWPDKDFCKQADGDTDWCRQQEEGAPGKVFNEKAAEGRTYHEAKRGGNANKAQAAAKLLRAKGYFEHCRAVCHHHGGPQSLGEAKNKHKGQGLSSKAEKGTKGENEESCYVDFLTAETIRNMAPKEHCRRSGEEIDEDDPLGVGQRTVEFCHDGGKGYVDHGGVHGGKKDAGCHQGKSQPFWVV